MFVRSLAIATALLLLQLPLTSAQAQSASVASFQVPATYTLGTKPRTLHPQVGAAGGVLGSRSTGSALGVDSLLNWSSYFYDQGIDPFGFYAFTWQYTMVGSSPYAEAESTTIRAPIVPVNIDMRDANGAPAYATNGARLYVDATRYIQPVLRSPIFSSTTYDSSLRPTQFTDAIQRAEFYNVAPSSWHTTLASVVRQARTMQLPLGSYHYALNTDGSCCRFVLVDINVFSNELLPPTPNDATTVVGAAENAGDITTRDMSTFLFPDTYLYFPPFTAPNNCCVLGFHGYDAEPGSAANGWREKRYVLNYSAWISPGIFGGGFTDVTALSHELAETFNDPFTNNNTPWWLAPNGNCQDNLETGDVIEGLSNAVIAITLNGFTYHPQNEALVQWFGGVTPSTAISGAYSYPDKTVLPTAAVSQTFGCGGPL